ncbi:MAG: acyl carrier protein [Novosphingobium sp.]
MRLNEDTLLAGIRTMSDLDDGTGVDSPLFSSGALDSVAMLDLIMFIEEESGIEIRPDEVTLENFDTPGRILRFAQERAA